MFSMQTDAIGDGVRTVVWVAVSAGGVLAGSLVLAAGSARAFATVAQSAGLPATAASQLAFTLAALVAPTAVAGLQTRVASDRGLPAVLGGLTLSGASVSALWLTGSAGATRVVPAPIVAIYALGLGVVVFGYAAAQFDARRSTPSAEVPTGPSYVRDDGDRVLPSNGGEADGDRAVSADGNRTAVDGDTATSIDGGEADGDLEFLMDDERE